MTAALGGLLLAVPACGSDASGGVITSSTTDPSMTLDQFTKNCDARHGTVEIHSHCGGANSCKGMSYDTGNQVLTEHTCKGMNRSGRACESMEVQEHGHARLAGRVPRALNTCTGYSCVVPS